MSCECGDLIEGKCELGPIPELLYCWRQRAHHNGINIPPAIETFMDRITDAQLIPVQHYYIDPVKLAQWVKAHRPKDRPKYQIIANNIRRIGFDEFCTACLRVLKRFSQLNNHRYVIILPIAIDDKRITTKSNFWVTQIMLRLMIHERFRLPAGIYSSFDDALVEHPYTDTAVFFDDAIFSGNQMYGVISGTGEGRPLISGSNKRPFVYVVIPYTVEPGFRQVSSLPNVAVIYDEVLPSEGAILEKEYPQPLGGDYRPITYFQHKMPDRLSVDEKLLKGYYERTIKRQYKQGYIPFIIGCEDPEQRCPPAWYGSSEFRKLGRPEDQSPPQEEEEEEDSEEEED